REAAGVRGLRTAGLQIPCPTRRSSRLRRGAADVRLLHRRHALLRRLRARRRHLAGAELPPLSPGSGGVAQRRARRARHAAERHQSARHAAALHRGAVRGTPAARREASSLDETGYTSPRKRLKFGCPVDAVTPPSITSAAPVMYVASSDARNAIADATSSGRPSRPSGTARR